MEPSPLGPPQKCVHLARRSVLRVDRLELDDETTDKRDEDAEAFTGRCAVETMPQEAKVLRGVIQKEKAPARIE